jgi:hypothetical protein
MPRILPLRLEIFLYPGWLGSMSLQISASPAAGMTGVLHHAQLLVERGLANFLSGLALNRDPPDHSLLSSKDYRHEALVPA